MTQFYGMRRLGRIEDWAGLAGVNNWVKQHSAYELANAWHAAGGFPPAVREAFDRANEPVLHGLELDVAVVEKPVFLNTFSAPSMTDIMAYAHNPRSEAVVVAVEGKANEPFGLPVRSWLKGDSLEPPPTAPIRPSRLRRLEFLAEQLGIAVPPDSTLKYQLLHRTASAVLEGALHGSAAAVVLVHSFSEDIGDRNWSDFVAFLSAYRIPEPSKGNVAGPVLLPRREAMPLFFLWVASAPRSADQPSIERTAGV